MRILFLLSLFPLFASAATPVRATQSLAVQIDVQIDARGEVTGARLQSPTLIEPIANTLIDMARHWRFQAPERDGRRLPVSTTIYAEAHFVPAPNDEQRYSVTLDYQGHGPRLLQHVPITYPKQLMNADLALSVVLDAEGVPGTIEVARASVEAGHEKRLRQYKQAAISALAHWRFEMEALDGKRLPSRVLVPISFRIKRGVEPRLIEVESRPELLAIGSIGVDPGANPTGLLIDGEPVQTEPLRIEDWWREDASTP